MLDAAQNEILTRTGPGTRMGGLFRRFWIPVLLSRELPKPDHPPLRVRLMGEDWIAFRDSDGRVGLVEPSCPHRGANLFYGRCEKGGLRCAYHGWKFDVDGNALDLPTMEPGPQTDRMRDRIRLKAIPVREWGDMVWAYLGPAAAMPGLPQMEFAMLPATHRFVSKKLQQCNWAQSCEGGLDTAHFSFLHMSVAEEETEAMTVLRRTEADPDRVRWMRKDGAPRFTVLEHEAGLVMGAARRADGDNLYWRISQFLMPNHGLAPSAFKGELYHGQTWVPIDDTSCWIYCYSWNPDRPLTQAERDKLASGHTVHAAVDEKWVPFRNRDNDYLIDRDDQRLHSYSGIVGVSEQDAAIQDSQGLIADRSREHLGPTDLGIVRFRRLMLESAASLAVGEEPPAVAAPEAYCVRGGSAVAPISTSMETVMVERFGDVHARVEVPPLNEAASAWSIAS